METMVILCLVLFIISNMIYIHKEIMGGIKKVIMEIIDKLNEDD